MQLRRPLLRILFSSARGAHVSRGGRVSAHDARLLEEIVADAKAALAIGTCAAYGGLPKTAPDQTGAVGAPCLSRLRQVGGIAMQKGRAVHADKVHRPANRRSCRRWLPIGQEFGRRGRKGVDQQIVTTGGPTLVPGVAVSEIYAQTQ